MKCNKLIQSRERYHEINVKLFVVDEVINKCLKPLFLSTRLAHSKTSPLLRQQHVTSCQLQTCVMFQSV